MRVSSRRSIQLGTEKVAMLSSSSGTEPNRMNGRNLPQRVEVMSTMPPSEYIGEGVPCADNEEQRSGCGGGDSGNISVV